MMKPKLIIMAAGMGSRYGGLKQIDPVDEHGHIIMDFSIYDAKEAGFEDVVFIIKKEIEEDFKTTIGQRIEHQMNVTYVYQDLHYLPDGFKAPEGRIKPWGTGHAILCCQDAVDGPFVVINADDFYGKTAFKQIYDNLVTHEDDYLYRYAMVGYLLKNTITENGHVARGVCTVNDEDYLLDIIEKTGIQKSEGKIVNKEEAANTQVLSEDCIVSMNLWGFSKSIMSELEKGFRRFLIDDVEKNPLKAEYYIPTAVDNLLKNKKATVKVLPSEEKWYGVTYKEDKTTVVKAVQEFKRQGKYPERLWR